MTLSNEQRPLGSAEQPAYESEIGMTASLLITVSVEPRQGKGKQEVDGTYTMNLICLVGWYAGHEST